MILPAINNDHSRFNVPGWGLVGAKAPAGISLVSAASLTFGLTKKVPLAQRKHMFHDFLVVLVWMFFGKLTSKHKTPAY